MCIDENKEFEVINQRASERNAEESAVFYNTEEIHRAKKYKAKRKAAVNIGVTIGLLVLAVFGIIALELIGWINDNFCVVLLCVAGCVAMFKTGYFWHDIKN